MLKYIPFRPPTKQWNENSILFNYKYSKNRMETLLESAALVLKYLNGAWIIVQNPNCIYNTTTKMTYSHGHFSDSKKNHL